MGLTGLVLLSTIIFAQPEDPPPVGAPWDREIAPLPHIPKPPVSFVAIPNGYQIRLNRRTAELLRDALDQTDEKQVARSIRDLAKDQREGSNPDEQTAATLEIVSFVVSTQLPGFKKAMRENMGLDGVVITMTGIQAPTVKFRKPRPRLEKAVEIVRGAMPLMPDDAQDAIEALRAVARTTPLFWKIEPRE